MWSTESGQALHLYSMHGASIESIAFAPACEWLVCSSSKGTWFHWLAQPTIESVLAFWLSSETAQSKCTALTQQLLSNYPSLPNLQVRSSHDVCISLTLVGRCHCAQLCVAFSSDAYIWHTLLTGIVGTSRHKHVQRMLSTLVLQCTLRVHVHATAAQLAGAMSLAVRAG